MNAVTTKMNRDAEPQTFTWCLPTANSSSHDHQHSKGHDVARPSSASPSLEGTARPRFSSSVSMTNSGLLRFPCRARGLHYDAGGTSSILVPPNAAHGLLLRCSNSECVASGRIFRWCAVCQTVAAKRNFWQRHGHSFTKKQNPKYYQRKKTWAPQEQGAGGGCDDTVLSSRQEMVRKLSKKVAASMLQKVSPVPPPPPARSSAAASIASKHPPAPSTLDFKLFGVRPETSSTRSNNVGSLSVFDDPGEWSDGEMEGLFEDLD